MGREKKGRKVRENAHSKGGGKNGCLIFVLFVRDKQEILKLIFNAINCLMKHNNLLC